MKYKINHTNLSDQRLLRGPHLMILSYTSKNLHKSELY